MSRSRLPVAHDASCCRPMRVQAILVEQHLAAIGGAMSNDFIMMIASVGQTCTHSSQNSQA